MEKNYYKEFLDSVVSFVVSMFQVAVYTIIAIYTFQFWTYYLWRDAYEWWSMILGGLWHILNVVFNFLVGLFS
jgi:hypothetical protein